MKFPWIECADTCRRLDNTKVHEAHEGHEVYFSCSSCPSCAFVASCRQRVQVFLSRRGEGENTFFGSTALELVWRRLAAAASRGERPREARAPTPERDGVWLLSFSPSPLALRQVL